MSSAKPPWRTARTLSRRQAIAELTLGAGALALAGCAGASTRHAAGDGSTLASTWGDPRGDGQLEPGPGSTLIDRTDLAPSAGAGSKVALLAHLTDAHVMDEESPARVPFLRRLGPPFNSTFRPQEALSKRVLAGALRSVAALRPDAVIQGGDLIDNAQRNELDWALALLHGGRVDPRSGNAAYEGVQSQANPDPFYYRPDLDAPRYPGLLGEAVEPVVSQGATAPVYPVLGDHDILVQGVLTPIALTRAIALGDRAIWDLPTGLKLPAGLSLSSSTTAPLSSPDSLAKPELLEGLIEQLRGAASVQVAADPAREQLSVAEVLARLRAGGAGGSAPQLDYSFDVGTRLRVIVLDLVRREGGSGGVVHPGQAAWLEAELTSAGDRWAIVVSHQPLTSSAGGERLLALLDGAPRVIAAICGHTHRSRITPRPSRAGGYWLIATSSLIDFPQQLRALRLVEQDTDAAALETWMIDHSPDQRIGNISRQLSYTDAQGGRPQGFAGGPLDRDVRLFKRAVS
jgi:3',5'-cyclic AMP phosphodiesterase CpdA